MAHTYQTATLIIVDCIHYNADGTQDRKVKLNKKIWGTNAMGCCNICWDAYVIARDEAIVAERARLERTLCVPEEDISTWNAVMDRPIGFRRLPN